MFEASAQAGQAAIDSGAIPEQTVEFQYPEEELPDDAYERGRADGLAVSRTILEDIIAAPNLAVRTLNWALIFKIAPFTLKSREDVGKLTGVGRANVNKDFHQICELFPTLRGRDESASQRHRETNSTKI